LAVPDEVGWAAGNLFEPNLKESQRFKLPQLMEASLGWGDEGVSGDMGFEPEIPSSPHPSNQPEQPEQPG
jgi:hypothetical protein